jgi:hypothetical protein
MIELAMQDTPGLATISLKTSLSLRCYLCAIKRIDNVADYGQKSVRNTSSVAASVCGKTKA